MAYTSCSGKIAQSIKMDCSKGLTGGYTGRAWYCDKSDIGSMTVDADGRIVSAITLATGGKSYAIDNLRFADPFTGSTTTGVTDAGFVQFKKAFAVRVPMRGSDTAKNIIEAACNTARGGILIVEKKDECGNGSYEVLGLDCGVKADPTTITRDESANGGAWSMTLQCTEAHAENVFLVSDNGTPSLPLTLAAFEALLGAAE